MTARFLASLALLASLTSGCIIHDNDTGCEGDCGGGGGGGGTQLAGDVSFGWTFAGLHCADVPDIQSVRISIPGEQLANNGVYPCQANGTAGIILHDFAGGDYSFTIEARGYGDELFYKSSGSFRISGDVHVDVDLAPAAGSISYAYLSWDFPQYGFYGYPSNPTCAQAVPWVAGGITHVEVYIDGAFWKKVPCSEGQSYEGVATPYLTVGDHQLRLVAVDSYDYAYYEFNGWLRTYAARPVAADYGLGWAVGGVRLAWTLSDSAGPLSCEQAGVDEVSIDFQDEYGNWVYGGAGDFQDCQVAFTQYYYLPPGTYEVSIIAAGSTGTYASSTSYPPTVSITAGEWPTGVVTVPLRK